MLSAALRVVWGTVWLRRSRVMFLLLASFPCAGAVAVPASASGLKPVISGLSAAPAGVASGGSTTVSASVSGALSCTLSSNKTVAGLPVTAPCEGGEFDQAVVMPANLTPRTASYKLTLTASSASAKTKASVTIRVTIAAIGTADLQGLSAGESDACAVLSAGGVDCWGGNDSGQLGNGTKGGPEHCVAGPCSTKPVPVTGISDATGVSVGAETSCALLATGHVECWGANEYGQLGDGTSSNSDTPVEVNGITDATQLSAGGLDTCAVLSTGHIDCWGLAQQGELGDGIRTEKSEVPVEVKHVPHATEVTVGTDSACALLASGQVRCWGLSEFGGLGDGTTTESLVPKPVTGLPFATQVSTGGLQTCALQPDGHADCWGFNHQGELGDGTTGGFSEVPVEVTGLTGATLLATGSGDGCGLLAGGNIQCWGWNIAGQLGSGESGELSDTPVEVTGITGAEVVATGGNFTCVLLPTGHVECLGSDQYGSLGNGTSTEDGIDTPVEVEGITEATR